MRVGTWNCAGSLQRKWGVLDTLDVDALVVQECDSSVVDEAPEHGWKACWRGTDPLGLSVLVKQEWDLLALSSVGNWSLPARVRGPDAFTLLGFWALPRKAVGLSYTEQADLALKDFDRRHGDGVFAGDFNACDHPSHTAFVAEMSSRGMVSAYHASRGERRDRESETTYFHNWGAARSRFHIDLVFVPDRWQLSSVTVGTFSDFVVQKVSDHVPVIADVTPRQLHERT